MARLPSSRQPLYRRLWLSGLRNGDPSPLRTVSRLVRLAISLSRRLSTQRCRRCDRSAMCRTQLQLCASASHVPCCAHCHVVLAADKSLSTRSGRSNDTVGLTTARPRWGPGGGGVSRAAGCAESDDPVGLAVGGGLCRRGVVLMHVA